jgi:hypothetical protein
VRTSIPEISMTPTLVDRERRMKRPLVEAAGPGPSGGAQGARAGDPGRDVRGRRGSAPSIQIGPPRPAALPTPRGERSATDHIRRVGRLAGLRTPAASGALLVMLGVWTAPTEAQFHDPFDGSIADEWSYFSGDGDAAIDFVPGDGYRSVVVDATRDRRNIWWAVIRRDVSGSLDLTRLQQPGQELRIEARLRTSHAPRRVNLHFNTQRTTDFHSHLMEYDLPDTSSWHTISMTTRGFDARPGDEVNAQLALMDWGLGRYRVDIDYIRIDVVDAAAAGPDLGEPLPYHPPAPDPAAFTHQLVVAQNAVIDLEHPGVNLHGWYAVDAGGRSEVVGVGGTRRVILRWDLAEHAGKLPAGPAVLELTTHSVKRAPTDLPDFGILRVAEVLGGDAHWEQRTVTLESLLQDETLETVFNTQMIMDLHVAEQPGGATRMVIPRPVVQRLLDGRTRGLVLQPLGALDASFHSVADSDGTRAARLFLDLTPP